DRLDRHVELELDALREAVGTTLEDPAARGRGRPARVVLERGERLEALSGRCRDGGRVRLTILAHGLPVSVALRGRQGVRSRCCRASESAMLRGRRNCMAVGTIEWRNGSVVMIDQRLLPQREVYRVYRDHREVAR